MTLSIAIAGGGIAGLTAALALSENGHSVTVFERANKFEDIGAGIQLSPNANKVLGKLGLFEAVKNISFEPEILQLRNGKTGRILSTLPFKTLMQQYYGAPYLVAHRGDLQSVMLDAAKANPLIHIQTGAMIDRFKSAGESVEIAGKNYDFLVAADGIHSALRAQIDPDAKIITDGQTAWRATLPVGFMPSIQNQVVAFLNSGAHLVAYKMGQRPELNLIYVSNSNQPPEQTGFSGAAQDLIRSAKGWKAWPLASVQSRIWHKGRAVMIGDAAHAMTPHAAQGGAMAIEDGLVLAGCVEKHVTIEAGFTAFQALRQPRIAQVSALSKQNRAIYQMGGVMAFGRNMAMPFIPPKVLLKRLDWLYGG